MSELFDGLRPEPVDCNRNWWLEAGKGGFQREFAFWSRQRQLAHELVARKGINGVLKNVRPL